jgi:hypothetical protein
MVGLGMDWARTFQSFVVILLIVTTTSRFLDRVDPMVVFARTLTSVITTIVRPPIMIISVATIIVIVVAPLTMLVVVVPTMVIGFIVPARWVLGS